MVPLRFCDAFARLLAVCVFCCVSLRGANRGFDTKSWGVEQGLLHQSITSIAQTTDGYLWVTTWAGVARFDGTKLKTFSRANTDVFTGGDETRDLVQDKVDGSLWIAARQGVVHFKDGRFQIFGAGPDGFEPRWLGSSRKGGVWVDGGLGVRHVDETGKSTPLRQFVPAYEEKRLHENSGDLLEDRDGKLWLAKPNGIYLADLEKGVLQTIAAPGSPAGHSPHDLYEASDGSFYWLSANCLARYFTNSLTVVTNSHSNELFGLVQDWQGSIWVGGTGLFRLSGSDFTAIKPEVFSKEYVQALCTDDQGNLWAGTRGSGFFRIREHPFVIYGTDDGLLTKEVWVVHEAKSGDVLIGSQLGINRLRQGKMEILADREKMTRAVLEKHKDVPIPYSKVEHIFEWDNGTIQFQASGGPRFTFQDARLEYRPELFVPCLKDGADLWGRDWILCRQRGETTIAWISPQFISSTSESDRAQTYPYITEWRTNALMRGEYLGGLRSKAGDVWFGSWRSGLFRFQGDNITSYTTTNGLASNTAMPIQEDEEGSIWISTEKGLSRWKNGEFTNLGVEHGLIYGAVIAMLDDGLGYYWMGGHRAVLRIAKENLIAVADGRHSRLFVQVVGPGAGGVQFPSACKSKSGDLWFATSALGAIRYNPRRIHPPLEAPTVIEDVAIDGESVGPGNWTKEFRLPPGAGKIVRVEFTMRNFVDSRKARFHHRLRGHSEKWVEAEAGEAAQYIGLRPGEFQFEVASESPRGGWGRPATFKFSITPQFHETKSFYGACIGGGIFLIALIVQLRVRNSRRIYRLESENAVSKERERIAADMHDVLGSTLTKIGLQTELITQRAGKQEPTGDEVQKLRRTVRDAASELDEVIWLFTSSETSLEALVEHLQTYAEDFMEPSGLQLYLQRADQWPELTVTAENRTSVVRIVREALNNTIKHAQARHVWLSIDIDEGHLRLVVRDDGSGIKTSVNHSGNGNGRGIENMRQRVERLDGKLLMDQHENSGTRITVTVPLERLKANLS